MERIPGEAGKKRRDFDRPKIFGDMKKELEELNKWESVKGFPVPDHSTIHRRLIVKVKKGGNKWQDSYSGFNRIQVGKSKRVYRILSQIE